MERPDIETLRHWAKNPENFDASKNPLAVTWTRNVRELCDYIEYLESELKVIKCAGTNLSDSDFKDYLSRLIKAIEMEAGLCGDHQQPDRWIEKATEIMTNEQLRRISSNQITVKDLLKILNREISELQEEIEKAKEKP